MSPRTRLTTSVLIGSPLQLTAARAASTLTHVADGQPTMVDITGKSVTSRTATAISYVLLPSDVAVLLSRNADMVSAKGPVLATAIIAGTMAVKKTSELIPFCHPLPIDSCKISIVLTEGTEIRPFEGSTEFEKALRITCEVKTTHKTGVEMEALTGASVAALTVYDMLKAVSHSMIISNTRLVEKKGGKSDVSAS